MTGSLVAHVLSTAWRPNPHPTDFSPEELAEVLPLLLGSGAGALGWRRVKQSELRSSPAGLELQQAYRKHTLEAAIHERDIKQAFGVLRANGIEPILVKGWSIARLYPEKGLRPHDDTDIVVRPDQWSRAQTAISEHGGTHFSVDLHCGFKELDYRGADDLFASSQLVALGDVEVRVLRPEDSLRVLCLHLLHHGAFRPLWFCDLAVAVESRSLAFDWDRCLGVNRRIADRVACAIGIAHQLLDARVDNTPIARRAGKLPRWLVPTVLKQWERPFARYHGAARHRARMLTYLRHPAGVLKDLRCRWPNPIEATVYVGGPFNELPRFPFQIGECVARTAKFVARLPRALREGR